jgi:TonB-dependent receptor
MSTTQFPNSSTVKLNLGTGYRSGTTGGAFRRYAGGLDRFGRGGQPLPSAIPAEYVQRKSALSNKGFTPEELQMFGRSLIGDWTGTSVRSISPGTDFSLTYGNTFDHLGVVFSAVSNHKYDTTDEIQRYFGLDAGNILRPAKDFELTNDRESATAGLVGNLSLRLNDSNRIFLNSILTRDGSSENRFQQGIDAASGGAIRAYRSRYQIEQVLSSRLRGEHDLSGPAAGSLFEWNVAHSRATNDSNLRDNFYREADPGVFTLQVGFSSSGETDFYRLKDSIDQGGLSHSTFFAPAGGRFSGSVKAGIDHLHRTRDFGTRRFIFTTPNQNLFDLTLTPEELFTTENIRPGAFELREVTGINDAYTADHTIDAAYLMSDVAVGKWRFIGGARYESSDQRVTTFNPFDTKNLVESANKKNAVLPSLNVVNQLSGTTNVRVAYGRTVNRPEFRELSPFAFVEVTGGRSIAGNPALKEATLDSYDLRWETFPGNGSGGEVMAASIFFKKIARPIERIVQPTSDLRTSFVNAKSARLQGLELEYRRGLGMLTPALSDWSLNANYARITSRVTVDASAVGASTSSSRPLEGQADQSANLGLQFFRPSWGTMVRVLGSYVGKRLTDVGAFGLPDIYEQPYTIVDAVVSQRIDRFARGFELKLAATNLFNEKREFLEGGQIQRSYTPGRGLSLSIAYSPF